MDMVVILALLTVGGALVVAVYLGVKVYTLAKREENNNS